MTSSTTFNAPFGLYLHIPFCAKLCHYCDFAKTSHFSDEHVSRYFLTLEKQLRSWLHHLGSSQRFTSVFFGGGTPGLFDHAYAPLFKAMEPYLAVDAEITLEANPLNVTSEKLKIWRDLGINRISIGVQSFDPMGLKTMTRDHEAAQALAAIELALTTMPHVNADLIYGWKDQTRLSWEKDVRTMIDSGVNHMSLYALTFEGNTPFARAHRRGILPAMVDEEQEFCYEHARKALGGAGFVHEEISNWAKPGHTCHHNWLYWSAKSFVGVGAGAHGFVPKDAIGLRYSYPGDLRSYLRDCEEATISSGQVIDAARDRDAWLMEYVGCGLRCSAGIDLTLLKQMGFVFKPDGKWQEYARQGLVSFDECSIKLPPEEWFRETAWSGLVLDAIDSTRPN